MMPTLSIATRDMDRDVRARMAQLRVLITDSDSRTATLLRHILFALGIRRIEHSGNTENALEMLRTNRYDFIITDWDMSPFDGLMLARVIRTAYDDKLLRRDIPIIMLTGRAEPQNIEAARDAGINEFIARPYTAGALSHRILQIIFNQRGFIETDDYVGPCRRRRETLPEGVTERRVKKYTPPPPGFRPRIASTLPPILPSKDTVFEDDAPPEKAIEAQHEILLKSQGECVEWARAEITTLKFTFRALGANPELVDVQHAFLTAALAVMKQATRFNYALGAQIAEMLIQYAKNPNHRPPNENHMVVISKHIEAISVAFNRNVEQHGRSIAEDLIKSLHKLVEKLE